MIKVRDYISEIKKFKIIDAHMHLGKVLPNIYYDKYSDKRTINLLKKYNVVRCICSHAIGFFDVEGQMDVITRISNEFGNFISWYLIYNPHFPEKSLEIIKKNRIKVEFAGVKIHPAFHETMIDDISYYPLWKYSLENDTVILTHSWSPYTDNPKQFYANPLLLEKVLNNFRDLKIILGHAGGRKSFFEKVINFTGKYSHVYLDLSGDDYYPPVYRKIIDSIGPDRTLFGTDMPMGDIRYYIINVLKADLDDKERENILITIYH
ncbi:MAG: amidohydrolase family protein, partial [Actinobacteria bacterium]|nr:amidohydrolase family protein [Actinomycetota bacterium]